LAIETQASFGYIGPINAVGIYLAMLNGGYKAMPVIKSLVCFRGKGNDEFGLMVILRVKEQQLHHRCILSVQAKVDAFGIYSSSQRVTFAR